MTGNQFTWDQWPALLGQLSAYIGRSWTVYQLAIIAACFGLALVMSWRIEPWLEAHARTIKGNPGLLRVVIALLRRTEWILFLLLLWLAHTIVVSNTWPSRGYIISVAIALAFAWLASSVLTRAVRSRTLSRLLAISAFAYIAIGILDLREEASTLLDSIALQIGTLRLSALMVIRTGFWTILLLWIARLIGRLIENRIGEMEDLSPSMRVLSGKITRIALIVAALIIAVSSSGIDLTALTVLSGAIGVGIGFGLQKVVSNFVSGIIILSDKSIKPGDTIELGDTFGWINELRARFVSVVTRDGREYLIPNEDFITQQVVNWSFTNKLVRIDVDFGVSYDSDPHEVVRIAIEVAKSVDRIKAAKEPVCWLTAFGSSSLDFKLRFWIDDPQGGLTNIRGRVLLGLWDAFKEAGIGIPFPHREIIMRTPVEVVQTESGPKD